MTALDDGSTAPSQIGSYKLRQKVGATIDVIIDDIVSEEGSTTLVCRSQADAPDIDGLVYVEPATADITVGDVIEVTVTGSDAYDLWASQHAHATS